MRTLQIIVASTRPGRVGKPVADWIHAAALTHGGFGTIELVDLAEWNLPMMDEPNHPRLRAYENQHTRDWSATIDRGDAYLFVMPEYNHSFTAPLKNAIDYLHQEWAYKPVGFVSYGGVAAGTRAVQAIKPVLAALKITPIVEAVNIPFVHQFLQDGVLKPNEVMESSAPVMLNELVKWADALAPLRA